MKNKLFGMTLAELLIAVGVIGVIAVLTLPGMFSSYEDKIHTTAAKKAFYTLSNATEMLSDNGSLAFMSGPYTSTRESKLREIYYDAIKFKRIGPANEIFETTKYYKGSSTGWPGPYRHPSAVTLDGMFVEVCSVGSMPCNGNGRSICADINFDTNGAQGPNMNGFDMLGFYLVRKGANFMVVPAGTPGIIGASYPSHVGCEPGTGRRGCSYLRLYDSASLP